MEIPTSDNERHLENGGVQCQWPVAGVKQTDRWDCGLACVTMVLRYYGVATTLEAVKVKSRELGMTESVWTIELCNLMHQYGVGTHFDTVTVGVDPKLQEESFYSGAFFEDTTRVVRLMSTVQDLGIKVTDRDAPLADIVKHLRTAGPMIILVNSHQSVFRCSHCCRHALQSYKGDTGKAPANQDVDLEGSESRTPTSSDNTSSGGDGDGTSASTLESDSPEVTYKREGDGNFIGHFIVVVGYRRTPSSRDILYLDPSPSSSDHVCSMPERMFQLARHSFGTDVDTIYVHGKLSS